MLEDAILEGRLWKYRPVPVEWTPSVWTEIAEDAVSVMGKEAAVKAIKDAEEYMEGVPCACIRHREDGLLPGTSSRSSR